MAQQNGAESGFSVAKLLSAAAQVNSTEPDAVVEASAQQSMPAQNQPVQIYRRSGGSRVDASASSMNEIRTDIHDIQDMVARLLERGAVEHKVFDSLHAELKDYKNDFFYERLKPILRPLLFLYDSIQQFDDEVRSGAAQKGNWPQNVSENMSYFLQQLEEILKICEVTPLENQGDAFDARIHKAIETTPVEPEKHNTVQRVVRGGWNLNGRVLRAAEVVRGVSR